jgi:outer membrane protein assembly factor BamA
MRKGVCICFWCLLFLYHPLCTTTWAQEKLDRAPYEGLPIEKIIIERHPVFDPVTEKGGEFPYSWANRFHILTNERLIRKELLFREGEGFNLELAEESARNLRGYDFMGDVYIIPRLNSDSSGVEVKVITQDQWSTEAAIFSTGGGGEYTVGLQLAEGNLLGWGKLIQGEIFTGSDNEGGGISFYDPRLLMSRQSLVLMYEKDDYSRYFELSLGRPLYSRQTKWGWSAAFISNKGEKRLFYQGREFFSYDYDKETYSFSVTRSHGFKSKRTLTPMYSYKDYSYSSEHPILQANPVYRALIPESEVDSRVDLKATLGYYDYVTDRYLDNFGNIEDLTLGYQLQTTLGRSFRFLNSTYDRGFMTLRVSSTNCLAQGAYLSLGGESSFRISGDNLDRVTNTGELYFYSKLLPRQLLCCHSALSYGVRQEPSFQFLLGGDTGLRGYASREFVGHRVFLFNLEHRYYSPLEIFTVALGTALFVDWGYAWYPGEVVNLSDFRSDVGLGLRFGLRKSSGFKVLRLDFAKALETGDIYISFGTGMLFSLSGN